MNTTTAKPDDKYLVYLDSLRASGATNMFGACPFLMRAFPKLTRTEAEGILTYWMRDDRH